MTARPFSGAFAMGVAPVPSDAYATPSPVHSGVWLAIGDFRPPASHGIPVGSAPTCHEPLCGRGQLRTRAPSRPSLHCPG